MKKNVLIVSSSPRRQGNSDLLCDQFLQGALEAGHNAETIFLRDHKVSYCVGCGHCIEHKGTCTQKDEMARLAQKLLEADVIVLATPVYFYTMSAQLKTFIDRCCPYYTQLSDRDFYFILTAAETDWNLMTRTVESLRGFTSCLDRPREKGIVYGVGAWEKGDILKSPAMAQAHEMGRNV